MESVHPIVKARSGAALRRLGTGLLDFLYPPTCLVCGTPVAAHDALCAGCFSQLRPISAPMCPVLGLPFEIDMGKGALSAEALADPPPFRRARAALVYGEMARTLIARLKYADRPELARFCARLMVSAGSEFWAEKPVLVPVPMHRWRLFGRGYNQSTELAREISRLTGLETRPELVARIRATRPQVGLSGAARRRNLGGAFRVSPKAAARLGDRPVVLIDDVITTGATLRTLTGVLNRAGIGKVDVLGFARVVVGAETTI